MGGPNSGNWSNHPRQRDAVEETPCLRVRDCVERGAIKGHARVSVGFGGASAEFDITTKPHGRGRAWWIVCPDCKRCVGRLFVEGVRLTCRHCAKLPYRSTKDKHKSTALARLLAPSMGIEPRLARRLLQGLKAGMAERPHSVAAVATQCCNSRTRAGGHCRRIPASGKRRCYLHGGASTGATSAEGKAISLAALGRGRIVARERRWLPNDAKLKSWILAEDAEGDQAAWKAGRRAWALFYNARVIHEAPISGEICDVNEAVRRSKSEPLAELLAAFPRPKVKPTERFSP